MSEAVRVGLDMNVVVYSEGFDDASRSQTAIAVLKTLGPGRTLLPTQVLGELYAVLVRKGRMSREDAAGVTRRLLALHAIHPASRGQFEDALALASTHQLQFWDALILATAADAGCRILLSEDMSDGFVWRGCTVVNPFAEPTHPLLADALRA